MNHIYRLVWSQLSNTWIAVAENVKGHGKSISRRKLVAAVLSLAAVAAHAGPTGGQIVAGAGSINTAGNTTTINQTSQNLSLNWQNFNIAPQETVDFVQPSASSVAINRIFDTNGTQILGHLNANGQVFLINPNGILFGPDAQVNVGGLVASTLNFNGNVNPASPSSNGLAFSGTGSVINQGTITAASNGNGGYVALLGNRVSNQGSISAQLGAVALGAGSAVTLTFSGNSLLHMQVDQSTLNNLAQNGGLLQADGGQVLMTAGARDALLASVVNNTGIIEARTVNQQAGTITLLGGMTAGTVDVAGTLDASAPNGGNGGAIETSAATVKVATGTSVTTVAAKGLTGSWLIDPQDYTVAASGGDITGTQLGANLATTNVTLQSSAGGASGSGNVNINDNVTWSANTTLTLTASNNVNVSAAITANGANAGIAINLNTANGGEAASGSGSFNLTGAINLPNVSASSTTALVIGGTPYTVINSLGAAGSTTGTDLQGINGNLAGHYALGSNIDASATSGWNSGAGFTPIGNSATMFTGVFDGLGHSINDLTISTSVTDAGLFGWVGVAGTVRNVGTVGGSVSGGGAHVGGLVGWNYGTISNAYATGNISGSVGSNVGGLVGYNDGTINNAYATGTVTSGTDIGGLVGLNAGTISNAHASSSVSGANFVGGLVGLNGGTISNVYATGGVSGTDDVGGLAGWTVGTIINAYATGNVSGTNDVGGLVGNNNGTVSNAYAAGSVGGSSSVGGLVGQAGVNSTINNSFWDTQTTGQTGSSGGTGMLTAAMQTQPNFTSATTANGNANPGWDFTNTWVMYDGYTYPLLRSFMTPLTVTANNASANAGSAFSGGNGVTYTLNGVTSSSAPGSALLGTLSYGGSSQGATTAGSYSITPAGLYSTQQQGGYAINFVSGTLTLNPNIIYLTVSGETAANKVYNGTTMATMSGGTLSGVAAGDVVTLTQAGSFASKNVGYGIAVTASDSITVTGDASGDIYVLTQPTGLSANITPATLTISGLNAANKVYDGTTAATISWGGLVGVVPGDNVSLTIGPGSFATKNVGTGIAVAVSYSYSGADIGNYVLPLPNLTANITPATLTVSGQSAANKVYDGTTIASVSGGSLVGVVSGDAVGLTQGGSFSSKNVGTGIAVTAADGLSGADAGNYTLVQPSGLSASITPATLTVTGESAANKVYDGTTVASVSGGNLVGVVAGDSVSLTTGSGSFATKNVGTAIAVTAANSLSGADAGNYTLVQPAGLSANITPATLTVAGESAANKVYDGTNAATISGGSLVGIVAGDSVGLTQNGSFATKNVGTGIAVTATDGLNGADAGNYLLIQPVLAPVNITPATLFYTANASTAYSGITPGGLSGTINGFAAGDTLANATSGTAQWNTLANMYSLPGQYAIDGSGLSAANYVFAQATSNAKALTVAPGIATPQVTNAVASLNPPAPAAPAGNLSGGVNAAGVLAGGDGGGDSAVENANMTTVVLGNSLNLQIVDGGVRLPTNMVLVSIPNPTSNK